MWKPKKLPNNISDKDLYWTEDIVKALGIKGKLLYEWKKILEENDGILSYRDGIRWAISEARKDPKKKVFVRYAQLAKYLDAFLDNQPFKKDPK